MQRNAAGDIDEERKFLALTADAKARIAIYGSRPVIVSLSAFTREGAIIDTPERARAFSSVCMMMRDDSGIKGQELAPDDMLTLLFGSNGDFVPSE